MTDMGICTVPSITELNDRLNQLDCLIQCPSSPNLTQSLIFNGRDLRLVGSVQIQSIELHQEGAGPFLDIEKSPCERLSLKAFLGYLRALVKKLTKCEE